MLQSEKDQVLREVVRDLAKQGCHASAGQIAVDHLGARPADNGSTSFDLLADVGRVDALSAESKAIREADNALVEERAKQVEIVVQAMDRDGCEPIETNLWLPRVPREGDKIECWLKKVEPDPVEGEPGYYYDQPVWLIVESVTWTAYAPERVVVYVVSSELSDHELKLAVRSINEGWQP
jgi:hypothetical protein